MNLNDMFGLDGRIALVTGGSRGIGKMIAAGFIAQGAKVYISSRKAPACAETAAELGPNCIALPQDVSTVAGCKALAAQFAEHETKLDILVNNAGAAWGAPFQDFPESGWDKVMDLNVKSPFFLTQRLVTLLEAAATPDDYARVINIGSIDGIHVSGLETYSYAASKAGLIGFTKHLAAELGPFGVRVNAIAPGRIETPMVRGVGDAINNEQARLTPMGRLGAPEEVADLALYLTSAESSFVTGQTVDVAGGLYMT